jgi:putative thioredoxin
MQENARITAFVEKLLSAAVEEKTAPVGEEISSEDRKLLLGLQQQLEQDPNNHELRDSFAKWLGDKGIDKGIHDQATLMPAAVTTEEPAPSGDINSESCEDRKRLVALEQQLDQDPDNHEARHAIALWLADKGIHDQAIAQLLHIVKTDRAWNNGKAQETLVGIFDDPSAHPEAVHLGRARLANILFV